tara:strand:- start:395 stop:661 length:267 start_codon:yes stop_codon:yes gene_type:complete
MDFTILFQRFAEQSPLILGCGLVIWQLLKMYKEEKQVVISERKERATEIKELNEYVRERESEHIETLNNLSVILNSIDDKMNNLNKML